MKSDFCRKLEAILLGKLMLRCPFATSWFQLSPRSSWPSPCCWWEAHKAQPDGLSVSTVVCIGKWAVPSVTYVKAFTKATSPLQPKWAGSIHRRHPLGDPRRGLCQSSHEEQLEFAPKWLPLEETVFSTHPSWEESCPKVISGGALQETNTRWLWSCCWEKTDSALSPLTIYASPT